MHRRVRMIDAGVHLWNQGTWRAVMSTRDVARRDEHMHARRVARMIDAGGLHRWWLHVTWWLHGGYMPGGYIDGQLLRVDTPRVGRRALSTCMQGRSSVAIHVHRWAAAPYRRARRWRHSRGRSRMCPREAGVHSRSSQVGVHSRIEPLGCRRCCCCCRCCCCRRCCCRRR